MTGRMELVMAAEQAPPRSLLPWAVACSELAIRQCVVGNGAVELEAPTVPQPNALCSITGSLGCWRLLRSWCWWQSHFTTSAVC